MDDEARTTVDHEELANLAIYNYHEAVERGEAPDPDELLAHNPEIADELAAYLEDLEDLKALRLLRTPSSDDAFPPGVPVQRGPFRCEPGEVLGNYILREPIGRGGMGAVWKANSRAMPEIVVAIMTLIGPRRDDPDAVARFRGEARAWGGMRHPNIVRLSDFGEDAGRWYLVMELVDGGTVADRLDSYRADPRSAAVLVEKVARAIHHAHSGNPGILHLDIKPGNILLTLDGEPRVGDFGLALALVDDDRARRAREVAGTVPYMTPEMAEGGTEKVSTASDVYGLGALLYAMLTGNPPFRGPNTKETLRLVIKGGPAAPRGLNPKVDRGLDAICLKCLERDPARRYGSADALANDLRRWLRGRPPLAIGEPSASREILYWTLRHPRKVALGVVSALMLWAAGLGMMASNMIAENAREAGRLARQLERELKLIERATQLLAHDPRLRSAFGGSQAGRRGAPRSSRSSRRRSYTRTCSSSRATTRSSTSSSSGRTGFCSPTRSTTTASSARTSPHATTTRRSSVRGPRARGMRSMSRGRSNRRRTTDTRSPSQRGSGARGARSSASWSRT